MRKEHTEIKKIPGYPVKVRTETTGFDEGDKI